jgi:hypothetical protein
MQSHGVMEAEPSCAIPAALEPVSALFAPLSRFNTNAVEVTSRCNMELICIIFRNSPNSVHILLIKSTQREKPTPHPWSC